MDKNGFASSEVTGSSNKKVWWRMSAGGRPWVLVLRIYLLSKTNRRKTTQQGEFCRVAHSFKRQPKVAAVFIWSACLHSKVQGVLQYSMWIHFHLLPVRTTAMSCHGFGVMGALCLSPTVWPVHYVERLIDSQHLACALIIKLQPHQLGALATCLAQYTMMYCDTAHA